MGRNRGQAVGTAARVEKFLDHLRTVGPGVPCIHWPWTSRVGTYIHLSIDIERPGVYAHRWVFEQAVGPIPEGYEVCHNCPMGDSPSCVRPDHLWLGTHSQNIQDSYAKGRMHGNTKNHPVGEAHHSTQLTTEDVLRIRRLVREGKTAQRQLAREYGVTPTAINSIVKRRSWAHLPEETV